MLAQSTSMRNRHFGLQTPPARSSNPLQPVSNGRLLSVIHRDQARQASDAVNLDVNEQMTQGGSGLVSSIKNAFSAVADPFGDAGTALSNSFGNSDENARPLYSGEKHAFIKLPNGKVGRANYMGPGTHLIERLKRGDVPRTEVDKVSQAHDIRYGLGKNFDDVRKADMRMINKVRQLTASGGDSKFNTRQANLIVAKTKLEDFGVRRDRFATFGGIEPEDREIAEAKLRELEQEGYGMNPASKLKKQMMKRYGRGNVRMKGKGVFDSLNPLKIQAKGAKALLAKQQQQMKQQYTQRENDLLRMRGKGLRLAGGGLRLAGGGLSLAGGCCVQPRRKPRKRKANKRGKGLNLAGSGTLSEYAKKGKTMAIKLVKQKLMEEAKKRGISLPF